MEGEISVLAQILDKIEALSSELSEVKAQTQQFNERLARQEEAVSRPRQPPETQLRFSENPEDYVQRPTSARLPPEPRPRSSPEYADPRLPQGTPQLTAAAQRGSLDDSSTSRALTPAVSYVVARESVPHFKGDTSASQPLKRNQDVEAWIRSIENLVKPPTDEAYIQAARANCRGPAELIINSPLFDFIRDWETFKASLRTKFRGTYTSADFYKVLYENRMSSVQAPMDFYLQLEGHVYQGYRDHREAIGDPPSLFVGFSSPAFHPGLGISWQLKMTAPPCSLRKQPRGYGTPGTGSGMNQLLDISLQMSFAWMTTVTTATILIAHPELGLVCLPYSCTETSPATVAEDLGTWLDNVPFRVASKEKLPVQLAEFQKGQ
ncbi:hypothetical protein C7M84_017976 [Penaeus vannamei]|uniref:Retrotransposon gag domain-containing protein n=1 Tax=Penaeus vannamei TaxID=6689 RepID=A0A3R7LVC6_PENVA|nr:hypothetical protein C7M84_017976 [Penaeus vannamei]